MKGIWGNYWNWNTRNARTPEETTNKIGWIPATKIPPGSVPGGPATGIPGKTPSPEKSRFYYKRTEYYPLRNPGTGKTLISIGLGLEACEKGYKVLFVTVPHLITQIRESRFERTRRALESISSIYLI